MLRVQVISEQLSRHLANILGNTADYAGAAKAAGLTAPQRKRKQKKSIGSRQSTSLLDLIFERRPY